MNHYSPWVDILNKFHTSSEWIQTLWLFVTLLLFLGLTWCIMEIVTALARHRHTPDGKLLYSIYQNNRREFLIYSHQDSRLLANTIHHFKTREMGENYGRQTPGAGNPAEASQHHRG